ncbi:39S ribosomal protein L28, mitochondrial [Homalodisca vitripennis]|nr:39S ribosomal protein L28, mitochondrial [Homalodisca vitripennis]
MSKPDIFSRGAPSRLPEAYRKFYDEWKATPPTPVHYIPEPGKWKRDPVTGEVMFDEQDETSEHLPFDCPAIARERYAIFGSLDKGGEFPQEDLMVVVGGLWNFSELVWPVQNVPIPLRYPKEINTGIWGGEAVVLGYKKSREKFIRQKSTRWFLPTLFRSAVHSEILDKRLSVIVTKRTISLIVDHKGFDNYLLETSSSDLSSLLALKLKKKMLLALFDKSLYPDDPIKREKIYNKYKHHLDKYKREDLEWYALSITEAVNKLEEMEESVRPQPLKHQFRAELIEELKVIAENQELDEIVKTDTEKSSQTWLTRINPFARKS